MATKKPRTKTKASPQKTRVSHDVELIITDNTAACDVCGSQWMIFAMWESATTDERQKVGQFCAKHLPAAEQPRQAGRLGKDFSRRHSLGAIDIVSQTEEWFTQRFPARGLPLRPAQQDMALDIARVLDKTIPNRAVAVLADAGVGVGKSFAYLIPILLQSHGVYVISTSTLVLQNQLLRDMDRLARWMTHTERSLTVSVMKGEMQYVCRQRLRRLMQPNDTDREGQTYAHQLRQRQTLMDLDNALAHILTHPATWSRWDAQTVQALAVPLDLIPWVRVQRHDAPLTSNCANCKWADSCGFQAMRRARRRQTSGVLNVLIINHGLLLEDLGRRATQGVGLWETPTAIVIDEAHDLENKARDYFSIRFDFRGVDSVLQTLRPVLQHVDSHMTTDVLRGADATAKHLARVWASIGGAGDRAPFPPRSEQRDFYRALANLQTILGRFIEKVHVQVAMKGHQNNQAVQSAMDTVDEWLTTLQAVDRHDIMTALSLESQAIAATPADLSQALPRLWNTSRVPLLLTSATLLAGRTFKETAHDLGLHHHALTTVTAPSPFPYSTSLLIYAQPHAPAPPKVEDPAELAYYRTFLFPTLAQLLHKSQGRALILSTSRRRARDIWTTLRGDFDFSFPILWQDEADVLNRFAADTASVLVGTGKLFTGLDVPGDSLSMVVMDRIPYPVPTDPLWQAKWALAQQAGLTAAEARWAWARALLIQGAGRLIRSMDDRGVLALLDPRAAHHPDIKRALPAGRWTTEISDVDAFFRGR